MFPWPNGTRQRFFRPGNLVIGGLQITQERKSLTKCTSLPGLIRETLGDACLDGDSKLKEPFGVDATFVTTSDLYRATNQWRDFYSEDEMRDADAGLPFGFFYNGGCNDCTCEDFPVVFPVKMNMTRMGQFATYLSEGNYIDDFTSKIDFQIPVLNYEMGKIVLIHVTFERADFSGWSMDYDITAVTLDLYDWHWHGSFMDTLRHVLEILFLVVFLDLLRVELKEIYETYQETGQVVGYLFNLGNLLDWVSYTMMLGTFYEWYQYCIMVNHFTSTDDMVYDKFYENDMAVGRFMKSTEGLANFQHMMENLVELAELRYTYATMLCWTLLLVCLQTIKALDFHPRMGLITKTIQGGLIDLIFFMLLFITINGIYAFMGVIIFGDISEYFTHFSIAFLTLLKLMLGIYDPTDDLKHVTMDTTANYFIWSYQIITIFFLLNALLAIIVESYDRTKLEASSEAVSNMAELVFPSFVALGKPSVGCRVSVAEMERFIVDVRNNMDALQRALVPGMSVYIDTPSLSPNGTKKDKYEDDLNDFPQAKANHRRIKPSWIPCFSWRKKIPDKAVMATVVCENTDGTFKVKLDSGGGKIDVDRSSIQPIHVQQVRLPKATTDKVKATPKESLETSTLFYVLNKGTPENPKPAILDQTSLIVALKTVEPTMSLQVCYAITINILINYGYNADLNGDGVVSADEWAAFEKLAETISASASREEHVLHANNKSRLINLIL